MKQKYIVLVVAALILIAGGVWYVSRGPKGISIQLPAENATTTRGNGYTITQVPVDTIKATMPNLDRGITFSKNIPEATRVALQKSVKATTDYLKKDPTVVADWLNLALYYFEGEDFDGAREVWEFTSQALPTDTTSLDNLGKMYHFNLHEYAKAEDYFKQSLAINPHVSTPYLELFDLYRYSYKTSTSAAIDIMKAAMVEFPDSADPYIALARYYRDKGDTATARKQYTQAVKVAEKAGDVNLAGQIATELNTL
jgi:tetratricopeptide (TPR) repeat protein